MKSELNKKGEELTSIESYGFGKGYKVALSEWQLLLRYLERLALGKLCMDVILVGHSCVKKFSDPEGEDYERYNLRLQDSANTTAAGMVKEWADDVGFMRFQGGATTHDDNPNARKKGFSTGERLINWERHAAYDAKTRSGYPATLPVDKFQWGMTKEKK